MTVGGATILTWLVLFLAACGGTAAQPDGAPETPPAAALAITADMASFGAVRVGATSVPIHVDIANTGGARSGVVFLAAQGANVVLDRASCGALEPGAHCTAAATWTPLSPAGVHGTITAIANPGGVATVDVSGDIAPVGDISATPSAVDFGHLLPGETSAPRTIVVTNPGPPTGNLTRSVTGDAGMFVATDTCSGHSLATNGTCMLQVAFAPGALGSYAATYAFVATPGGAVSVTVTGVGDASPAMLSMTPAAHDFGAVIVPCTAAAQTFTVTNTGGTTSGVLAVSVEGLDAADFVRVGDTCSGTSLISGASCTVAFRPMAQSSGSHGAGVYVRAGNQEASASMSFTTLSTVPLRAIPSLVQFGNVDVGATSTMTVTISNEAFCPTSPTLTVQGLGGADPSSFSLASDTCSGVALAGGESCTIAATFAPTSVGQRGASVVIDGPPFLPVGLSGIGGHPSFALTPASYDFGSFTVGDPASSTSFTVENTGPETAGPVRAAITGGSASAFAISQDDCTGTTLTPGATCSIIVATNPTFLGPRVAQLEIMLTSASVASATLSAEGVASARRRRVAPVRERIGGVAPVQLRARPDRAALGEDREADHADVAVP